MTGVYHPQDNFVDPDMRGAQAGPRFGEQRNPPAGSGIALIEKQAIIDHTLLGRTGRIDDVVRAVNFILKDAPFMTGSTLRIDGGYVLGGERVGAMPEGVV